MVFARDALVDCKIVKYRVFGCTVGDGASRTADDWVGAMILQCVIWVCSD
jgi:hypothetical protein